MLHRLIYRHRVLSRPGVGRLIVTAYRWSPNRIASVHYQPPGEPPVSHPVPEEAWERVLAAGSFEEVMAAIRAAERDANGSLDN